MPTSPASSSTGTTTSATRSSARAPATRRRTSRPARSPRRCSRRSGSRSPAGRSRSGGARGDDGMREATDAARKDRDTLGGIVEVVADGCPPGLGSYAEKSDRLDARLAFALMGIQAVKGVEVGDGFALARVRGSEAHDEIDPGLVAAHEPRRRARGGNHERRAARRARRDEAAADADEAARLRRSRHRRGGAGARRAQRRPGGRGARRRRRGRGRLGARLQRRRTSSAATRSSTSSAPIAPTSSASGGRERPEPPPRARRLHGRGQDDARRGGRPPAAAGPSSISTTRSSGATGATIEELFARDGEAGLQERSRRRSPPRCSTRAEPAVIALGGGAVLSAATRETLSRVARSPCCSRSTRAPPGSGRSESGRPLAIDEQAFHALYRARLPVYEEAADAHAHDADGIVLAAAGIDVRIGALDLLEELVPGTGAVEIVADANVAGIHGVTAQLALGDRDIASPRGASRRAGEGDRRARAALARRCGSAGTARSSGSAAAARPTSRASRPRRTCAACRGWRCRRRSSARSTPRSAARPPSTSPAARTSSARSTGRRGS